MSFFTVLLYFVLNKCCLGVHKKHLSNTLHILCFVCFIKLATVSVTCLPVFSGVSHSHWHEGSYTGAQSGAFKSGMV